MCGVVWCGVAWRGVAWRGLAWRDVVVVCRRCCYQKAMAGMVLHTGNASLEGCVSKRVLYVVCCAPLLRSEPYPRSVSLVQGRPGDSLPLRPVPLTSVHTEKVPRFKTIKL